MTALTSTRAINPLPGGKHFRICGRCPFYCRDEEMHRDCPWCELPLIGACACGAVIRDPVLQGCATCGKRLRIEAKIEGSAAGRVMTPALLVLLLFSACAPQYAQASSANFRMQQSTFNGGGTTSVSPSGTNYRLTASLGQESVIGVSSSPNYIVQSGFWSYFGSGLVPVLLMVQKNGVIPADPDLSWSGNNPNYMIYRSAGCATVFSSLLTTVTPQSYTDAAPLAAPLVCYSVLATAPGPAPPSGEGFSPNPSGSLDPLPDTVSN